MRKPVCDSFAAAEDGPLARSRSVAQSGLCPALQDRFHGRFDAGSAPGLLVGAVPGVAESPVRGAPLIHNVPAQGGPLHLNGKVGALMLGSSQLVGRRFRASAKRAAALRSPRRARMRWRAPMVRP